MKNQERKEARRYDTPYRCRELTAGVYSGYAGDRQKRIEETFAHEKEFYPEKSRYHIYFGDIHGHSSLSDGSPDIDAYYQDIRDTLSLIPDGASVSASTFYTTFLSQRSILYDIRHSSPDHILETEYIAFSITSEQDFKKYADEGPEDGLDNFISLLEANGYEQYAELPGVLVIYQKTA